VKERGIIMAREMVRGRQEDLTSMLPVDAWLRGLSLILVDPKYYVDPVYLLGNHGVIQEWDYIPSLAELDEACKNVK
jgi:hypothetical protein